LFDDIFSRCVGICPEGTYPSDADKLCLPCHSQCRSCRNSSDIGCISCKSGLFLIHDAMTCAESCPEQYYTGKNLKKEILKLRIISFIRSSSWKMYSL
jgi:ferredoxin